MFVSVGVTHPPPPFKDSPGRRHAYFHHSTVNKDVEPRPSPSDPPTYANGDGQCFHWGMCKYIPGHDAQCGGEPVPVGRPEALHCTAANDATSEALDDSRNPESPAKWAELWRDAPTPPPKRSPKVHVQSPKAGLKETFSGLRSHDSSGDWSNPVSEDIYGSTRSLPQMPDPTSRAGVCVGVGVGGGAADGG